MRLTRLHAVNFLGLHAVDLQPRAPVVLVCGYNESGKTSLRDVIEWGITGLLPGRGVTTKKGAAAVASGKGCKVALDLGGVSWERTPAGPSLQEGELARRFPTEMVRALLSAWRFVDLAPAARRQLVATLTADPEEIGRAVGKLAADAGLTSEAEYLAETAANDLDGAERHAVDMRRQAKRQLEELPAAPPPATAEIAGESFDLAGASAADVQARCTALGKERDELLKEYGVAKLLDTPDVLREKLEAVRKQLFAAGVGDGEGAEQCGVTAADVNRLLEAKLKAARKVEDLRTAYTEAKLRKESAAKQIAAADKLKGACPTCGREVTAEVQAKLTEAAVAAGERAAEDMARLTAEGKAATKAAEDAAKAHQTADDTASRWNELQIELLGLEEKLKQAEAFPALEAKVDELGARIDTGRAVLDALRSYEHARERFAGRAALAAKVAAWDAVAKGLGAGGEVRKIAAKGFNLEAVAEHAKALFGRDRALAVDGDWNLTLGGLPAEMLSESARWRLGAAFAAVLAAASGLGFLVLDRADLLDPDNRLSLLTWLDGLAAEGSGLDSILVLATSDELPTCTELRDVYAIADGGVKRAEP